MEMVYDKNSILFYDRPTGPVRISECGAVNFSVKSVPAIPYGRPIGPANIYASGRVVYLNNGKRHRTTGPAIIYPDESVEYWVNGSRVDPTEFFLKYGVL